LERKRERAARGSGGGGGGGGERRQGRAPAQSNRTVPNSIMNCDVKGKRNKKRGIIGKEEE